MRRGFGVTRGRVSGRSFQAWVAALSLLQVVACRPAPSELVLVGTVERTEVEVSAPISERIVESPRARGDRVRAGDLLVRLDPSLAQADVAAAEAGLAGAQARVAVSDADWERARQLGRERVTSAQALDRARLARAEAHARLREAQAGLAASRVRLHELEIASPADGVLDQLPFDSGERVPAGAVVAVLLADGDPWVRVWLPERALASVGPGAAVTVHVDGVPGAHSGRVLDVSREPSFTPHYALTERERGHLVYETRVAIEGGAPLGLRPGIPAQVRLQLPEPDLALR